MSNPVAGALHLRAGEGRTLAILGGYLLLCTATTTILSATKNGLFLSVYPGRLIPHVVIAAALLTAAVAVVFSGIIAGTARRSLAVRLTAFLVVVVLASRWAFGADPRASLLVYLAMSVVQVLTLTHAWDFVGDLLTGRQAKRLAPLIGSGASIGALLGGASVPAGAHFLGTENLLLVGALLLALGLPLLFAVPEPARGVLELSATHRGAVRAFATRVGRGFKSVGSKPLLRLMALGLVGITITGTLIELQFKLALQESYDMDRITAIVGVMSAVVGTGTLLLQLAASRWLFPKLGVSFAAALHGGTLAFAAGGAVVFGGIWILAALQALDDILQFSIQKPVEQVSLLPFAGPVKSSAIATLGGVMRPLSKAAGGAVAILFLSQGKIVPMVTAASAAVAFVVLLRHRRLYLAALMQALSRHTVEFRPATDIPLLADREALGVIDQGLEDADAAVVVFSLSLLEQLTPQEAVPRATRMLGHGTPEVRAEAASVLGRLDLGPAERPLEALLDRLPEEGDADVLAGVLETLGGWGAAPRERVGQFLSHPAPAVRTAVLVALGRSGWPEINARLQELLSSSDSVDRVVAASATGALGHVELLPELAAVVDDGQARPAALEALSSMGPPAVPVLTGLLGQRNLPLPLRRSVITALAGVLHPDSVDALLELVSEPALGPAALTSLQRLRRDERLDPVEPGRLRLPLKAEVERGFRHALAGGALKREAEDDRVRFIAEELQGLAYRSAYRVIRILSLSHDPARLEAVRLGLFSSDIGRRSNALELLEGMVSMDEARLVMPFAEAASDGFVLDRVVPLVPHGAAMTTAPLQALLEEPDWWTRSLALHGLGRDDEITVPGRPLDAEKEEGMIPLIERVMVLKGSELFRSFPGADLAGIAAMSEVVHLDEDEIACRQGDPGDAFYMVVRGSVRITRGSVQLAILGEREGFGEMAILDQETRSATATAAEPTVLLRLDRDSFDRLIEQNPSVARGIYRVLTKRLRNTLAQIAAS